MVYTQKDKIIQSEVTFWLTEGVNREDRGGQIENKQIKKSNAYALT